METLATLYPRLSRRDVLPAYYTPAYFGLAVLPFVVQNKRLAVICSLPLILYMSIAWPCFTTGRPSSDYYNNSHFIAMPMWYLDFVLAMPRDGHGAPEFVGRQTVVQHQHINNEHGRTIRWNDLTTTFQRLKWAFSVMLPAQRGIGWNWQVKGVPLNPDATLPKWQYVTCKLRLTLFYYLQSLVALVVLGLGVTLRKHNEFESKTELKIAIANGVIGWAGAIWVWDRLGCAYSLVAAFSVAVGVTDTWEWPPLFGRLADAWSVRQMWSSTYHQACRRLLSQPAKRVARLLGLAKGSVASNYTQLFVSFGISCLFHQAQMFNVTRKDMGELAFLMSQPLAIVFEDLVHKLWRSCAKTRRRRFESIVGYAWTFAWFSFSLQIYISGLVKAGIIEDWLLGDTPLTLGRNIVHGVLTGTRS